jgi:hypothetical protein
MWERVIVSVWGTTTNCEGKRNFGSNGRNGVSWKYQEVLERWKKVILLQLPDISDLLCPCRHSPKFQSSLPHVVEPPMHVTMCPLQYYNGLQR